MTTRLLNTIPRENAADYRRVLNRQDLPALKRKAGPKAMVSQYHAFDPKRSTHTLQLPIYFEPWAYQAKGRDTFYIWVNTPAGRKRVTKSKRVEDTKKKRKQVWAAMMQHMPTFARCIPEGISLRVTHIEWIRIGARTLDDDNLQTAFKSVRDALCSFLVWGGECGDKVGQIGRADDILKKRGTTWDYKQQKCERNPRAYGVKLVMHCTPLPERPSTDSESSPTSSTP